MVEIANHDRLQPSLLDRLTDSAPETRRESVDQQTVTMQRLRQAVLRDLAWLLNTTNLAATDDIDPASAAARSTINFGIPGLAGVSNNTNTVGKLETLIADAIRTYEPRIRPETLKVRARQAATDQAVPALVFEISGELWAQPVPQQLFLETSIELETRLAVVTSSRASR